MKLGTIIGYALLLLGIILSLLFKRSDKLFITKCIAPLTFITLGFIMLTR